MAVTAFDAIVVMDTFSYITALISILIGITLTQLLTQFGVLMQYRKQIKIDILPTLWAIFMFLLLVLGWAKFMHFQSYKDWSFLQYLLTVLTPVCYYLMATVILPDDIKAENSMRQHFLNNRIWFFSLATLTPLLDLLVLSTREALSWQAVSTAFVVSGLFLSGILIHNRKYQLLLVKVMLVLLFTQYIRLTDQLV